MSKENHFTSPKNYALKVRDEIAVLYQPIYIRLHSYLSLLLCSSWDAFRSPV